MQSIPAVYNYWFVALSFLIAIFTSYSALNLAERVTANRGKARGIWLIGGATAMGSGIWCMHYVGMLAFELPIPVYYHVPTVALSLFAAILASFIALFVVSFKRMTILNAAIGSVLMGAGISSMHYVGMAAMRLSAMHEYDPTIWILSILSAVAISFIGLRLIYYFRDNNRGHFYKILTAIVLGMAIPIMHYTGMAAVSFRAMSAPPDITKSIDISTLAIIAIFGLTGLILGLASITALIDRRMSDQNRLFEREREMLRALIDNIPDCMYVKDVEGRFILANKRLAHTVGLRDPQLLIGKSDYDFFPFELAKTFREDELRITQSGQALFEHEESGLDAEGNTVSMLTTKVPLRDNKDRVIGIVGVGRDISERKRTEEALRLAERKYRSMFDEALVGIFKVDAGGRLLHVNQAMASFLGYGSAEEMMEILLEPLWTTAASPQRAAEFAAIMKQVGYVKSFELEVIRKDGDKIWISSSVRAMFVDGVPVHFIGMFEDITERRLLREQLLQAQKLESVGQLASGIAHEINTPVQYIGDNVRFLKEGFQDLERLNVGYGRLLEAARRAEVTQSLIEDVSKAVNGVDVDYLLEEIPLALEQTLEGISRVSALVGAMKEFSHPGTGEKTPTDLNHAIESTVTVARNEWKYVAELNLDLDPSLPLVSCLAGEVNQVVLNLIVNAAHAIADFAAAGGPEKGLITIKTRNLRSCAEIRIQDSGAGIPEQIRTRIFDPFFTTKEVGKGTGQGLAIARSVVVDKHGGTIDFETKLRQGTVFIIHLPCMADSALSNVQDSE